MEQNKDIFSGLEELGFENLKNIDIYEEEEKEEEKKEHIKKEVINEEIYLYDKKVDCPVCGNGFSARAVRTNGYWMKGRDTDFYIKYDKINPYFYDVFLCNECGYAAMKSDFEKLRKNEIQLIKDKISLKWHGRKYPLVYDINIAIERYKLSLLNYTVMGSKASKKAMNCLKIAWMYRIIEDSNNEKLFMEQALIGFKDAYFNESLPVYGMNKFMIMYLIGELNRRLGNYQEALRYYGEVLTSQGADKKIKDLARDQKDLLKENINNIEEEMAEVLEDNNTTLDGEDLDNKKKRGLFSRFFK